MILVLPFMNIYCHLLHRLQLGNDASFGQMAAWVNLLSLVTPTYSDIPGLYELMKELFGSNISDERLTTTDERAVWKQHKLTGWEFLWWELPFTSPSQCFILTLSSVYVVYMKHLNKNRMNKMNTQRTCPVAHGTTTKYLLWLLYQQVTEQKCTLPSSTNMALWFLSKVFCMWK